MFSGDVDEVKSLIEQRVDVNYQSQTSRLSALHVAAYCSGNSSTSNRNAISLNLDDNNKDTNENSNDATTTTATTTATVNKYANFIEIVDLLCKAGSRVNSKDAKSLTPLHYACRSNSHETVRILLANQADVNSRDKNWQAALHICAMYNAVKCASLLLEHMLNIDVSDRQGRSALAHAAFNGNTQVSLALIMLILGIS